MFEKVNIENRSMREYVVKVRLVIKIMKLLKVWNP